MKGKYAFFSAALVLASMSTAAQVNLVATGGITAASYVNLKSAFDQINSGIHTGAITLTITNNTTEPASCILNASGSGAASYSSVLIQPGGGGARTITTLFNFPDHLVDLNGADNVTIDGLNTGGNSLTIANPTPGASSAIRFIGDAVNNTITRCSIQGVSASLGAVFFSTGTITGNDNNTISHCTIEGLGSNFPRFSIYSLGSSTTVDNSLNTIAGNNIANYFNANTLSAGVCLFGGNYDWTISNNSFYQTAARTYLSGDIHAGIYIGSGSKYTITGNYIGGNAPNAGGGAYIMQGNVAIQFTGIHIDAGTTMAVTSVQGNTIANISINTTSSAATENGFFCGINIAGGNVDAGTVTRNTIGAANGTDNITGTSTAPLALMTGINTSSTGMVSIQHNSIGAMSNAVGLLIGINISGVAAALDITGNTIGNTTSNNFRSGSPLLTSNITRVSGIKFNALPVGAIAVDANTLQHIASYGVGSGGFVRGIETIPSTSATTVFRITNNNISNLVTYSFLANITEGQGSATGITLAAGNNSIVAQNNISNIANAGASASAAIVAGIAHANATNTGIYGNKIYSLTHTGTSTNATTPSEAAGILIRSGTGTISVYNNMISLGSGQTTNTAFVGIQANHGATPDPVDHIYHNTITIEGTVASGAQPSIGIYRGDFGVTGTSRTQTVSILNNMITNNRSGGSGKHYAIANNLGSLTSATGWAANASNNNVLNARASTIGYWSGDQTFAGWKTASNGDGLSVSAVTIIYNDAANGDLHLNMGATPTPVESGAVLLGSVTSDYDGQSRPGPAGSVNGAAYAPDIGADEFDGVYLDIMPPNISCTPLGFTCSGINRTLVATITDFSGVPVTGVGLPRLFWRINAGAYTAVTGVHTGAGQYEFTFGAGAVTGNTVSYYIVAQDAAASPNVTSFPLAGAGGYTVNPPAAATPPVSPFSYASTTNFPAGIYTVGSGGNYATLTSAINAYNTQCLTGPVIFELIDANYIEPGAITIIRNPYASAVNTLTIRPAAATISTVFFTVANGAALTILGNYITIEGSNNGSSSRHLTIRNQSPAFPVVIHIGSTLTSPVNNITIKNTVLLNGANTGQALLLSDAAVPGAAGYFNNIQLINNSIQRASAGIYAVAALQAGNGSGLSITGNLLNTPGTLAIKNIGIYLQGTDGAFVTGNTIGNFESAAAENDIGIWLANGTVNTTVAYNNISTMGSGNGATAPTGIQIDCNRGNAGIMVTGNTISGLSSPGGAVNISTNGIALNMATGGVVIARNKISNIKNTAGGFGAHGILLNSTSTAAGCVVNNNFVSDVAAFGSPGNTAGDNGYGITVNNGAGYDIFYNTVNMVTDQTNAGSFSSSLMVTAGVTVPGAVTLRNNIFSNMQTGGSAQRYAVYSATPNTVFAAMDYNNFHTAGPNIGFINGNRTTLADLQTGFGGNDHSLNVTPVFTNPFSDLHLTGTGANSLLYAGTPIAGYADDIDQENRNMNNPVMGADEMISCGGTTIVYTSGINGASYQWQVDTGSGFTNISGSPVYSGTATSALTLTTPPTSYNTYKYRCVVNGSLFSNVYTYRVGVVWTGAVSTSWNAPGNWSCGIIPDANTDVVINTGVPRYPVVGSTVTVRSIKVTPGASVTVNTGFSLMLTGR